MPFEKGHKGYGKKKDTPEETVDQIAEEITGTVQPAPITLDSADDPLCEGEVATVKPEPVTHHEKLDALRAYMSDLQIHRFLDQLLGFHKNAPIGNEMVVTLKKEKE